MSVMDYYPSKKETMQNITITINGVTKKLELIGLYESDSSHHCINGKWYREVEEKDYEILSFNDKIYKWDIAQDNNYYRIGDGDRTPYTLDLMMAYLIKGPMNIDTVRRLSDNEVFRVGDHEKYNGKITEFRIDENRIYVYYDNNGLDKLGNAKKIPKSTLPILLKTEDGKEITDGEQKVYGIDQNFKKWLNTALNAQYNDLKYFSTEEARDEYILYNKPVSISYTELTNRIIFKPAQIDLLQSFFKQKII